MSATWRLLCILLTSALAFVILSACGGDDSATTTPKPAASGATATKVATSTGGAATATAAQGGGDSTDLVPACTLLSDDEVSNYISPLANPEQTDSSDPTQSNCLWRTSDPANSG